MKQGWRVAKACLFLAGAVAAGGIVAPVLLLFGLTRVAGSTASLLLTRKAC